MVRRVFALTSFSLLACCLFTACSRGPEVVPVSGRVTRKGEPISGVTVYFRPDDIKAPVYLGGTGEDGGFTLMSVYSKFGVVPGEYKVSFGTPEGSAGGKMLPGKLIGSSSPWRVTVPKSELKIELDVSKDQPQ